MVERRHGHPAPGIAVGGLFPGLERSQRRQRLDEYLRGHGRSDSQGNGDYFLFDEDYGGPQQSLTIYRIEFLTHGLVKGIQDVLRDGYQDWSVFVSLDLLPPVEGVASDGIDIYADRVVEKWDCALLAGRLGKRFKF